MEDIQATCLQPSQAQLALAIAIVNSKPAAVPVLDHINHIRPHIKQSKSLPLSLDPYKYFDSVAFWKQAYTKAEDEQSKLNNRIFELEQRVESLKSKVKDDEIKSTPENGKRKEGKDLGVSGSQKKRQKTAPMSHTDLTPGMEVESLDDIISHISSKEASIGSLMRHLSTLQQNMHKRPNWTVICVNTINLCKAAEVTVNSVFGRETTELNLPKQKATPDATEPDTMAILAVIEAIHKLLCHSINKMINSAEGRKLEGQATYHLVSLFETILRALERQCQLQAIQKNKLKHRQQPKRQASKAPEPKPSKVPEINSSISFDEVAKSMRRILAGMMLASTTLITKYENVLEGYLFVLLHRVGTILSVIEFKEMISNPELQAAPDKLPIPEGLSRAGTDDRCVHAAEIETKHLVWLLEKAVALVYSISMKSTLSFTDGSLKSAQGLSDSLLRFTKKKMQRTLLKAVFREDEPLFLDSFKRPQLSNDLSNRMDEVESASEWFSREVWRLLGWDILESIWK